MHAHRKAYKFGMQREGDGQNCGVTILLSQVWRTLRRSSGLHDIEMKGFKTPGPNQNAAHDGRDYGISMRPTGRRP